MYKRCFERIPGLLLAIALGLLAYWVAGLNKAMDALVVGIVFGMLIRAAIGERKVLLPGLDFAPKLLIPLGIILYGVNLEFHKLASVQAIAWLQLIVGIVVIFWVVVYVGSRLGLSDKTQLLIGMGTSICGASAIVLASPVIEAKKEDTGTSLIVITIIGLLGVAAYPTIQSLLDMSKDSYAFFCATTLHQTGLVKMAANFLGKECVDLALSIKMARTAMIIPILIGLSWYASYLKASKGIKVRFGVPWFLWGFLIVGLLFSFSPQIGQYSKVVKPWASLVWAFALTSIGLSVDIRKIIITLPKPILLGALAWFSIICLFFFGYFVIGY